MVDVFHWLNANANSLAVMLGVAAFAGILWYREPTLKEFIRGRYMKEQRRKEVHQLLADGYTEKVMDMIHLGQLTWAEAREEGFLRLKRAYPTCKDLYPSEATLKERIGSKLGKVDEMLQQTSDLTPVVARKLLFTRKK